MVQNNHNDFMFEEEEKNSDFGLTPIQGHHSNDSMIDDHEVDFGIEDEEEIF